MQFANAENRACADCSRSNRTPAPAKYIVGFKKTNKKYAMCESCYEVSHVQPKTPEYFEWMDRSGCAEHIKVEGVCATCLYETNKLVLATDTIYSTNIPACKGCKEFYELNDSMLTYYERGWLDELYSNIFRMLRGGLSIEVGFYK